MFRNRLGRRVGLVAALLALPVTARARVVPVVDAPLRVSVVDSAGNPCGDVPVAIVIDRSLRTGSRKQAAGAPDPLRRSDFLSAYIAVQPTAADGTTTFDLAALQLAPQEFEACVVRLALPLLDPIQVEFDPKQSPAAPLRLARPDCGSVRFEVPGIAKGTVRLRAIPVDAESVDGLWGPFAHDRFPIVDGVAIAPLVPIHQQLAFEATWDGLPVPLTGRFFGPQRLGEEMRFAPPTLAAFPSVRGRLVDDDGRPVANRKVQVTVSVVTRGSSRSGGAVLTTDRGGCFELPLVDEVPKGGKRLLTFTVEPEAAPAAAGSSEATPPPAAPTASSEALVELPKPLPAGPHELGDVILIEPGSLRWLARLSDDELLQTWEKRNAIEATPRIDLEACLLDMARR